MKDLSRSFLFYERYANRNRIHEMKKLKFDRNFINFRELFVWFWEILINIQNSFEWTFLNLLISERDYNSLNPKRSHAVSIRVKTVAGVKNKNQTNRFLGKFQKVLLFYLILKKCRKIFSNILRTFDTTQVYLNRFSSCILFCWCNFSNWFSRFFLMRFPLIETSNGNILTYLCHKLE